MNHCIWQTEGMMAVSFQYYSRRDDFLFTSDSPPVKVYCSFHYSTCSSIRHINVSYSSVDHGKISDYLQASAEKLPVSFLVLAFCFWGFTCVIYVNLQDIRLQNYGTGKHLKCSPNLWPSSNGYNSCDFIICGWCLLGCFQGPLMIKSPQALQILAYIFCPINFPSCYYYFFSCCWVSLVLQASYFLLSAL